MLLEQADGAQGRNRTTDTRIFNPLLYRLSYLGVKYLFSATCISTSLLRSRAVLNNVSLKAPFQESRLIRKPIKPVEGWLSQDWIKAGYGSGGT